MSEQTLLMCSICNTYVCRCKNMSEERRNVLHAMYLNM